MSGTYLQFQSLIFPLPNGKRSLDPGIVSACRHLQHTAQQRNKICESQLLDYRVPGSDSLAKYAVAFFKMSRSIFTTANSRFTRVSSCSISVKGRCNLPTSPSLPALYALIQFTIVDFGNDNRFPTSDTDKPPSVTNLTASSLNSLVYAPLGILSISTPPSLLIINLGVHLFQPTTGSNNTIATYTYDPFGRRIKKQIIPSPPAGEGTGEGVITYYLYSDEGLVGEYDATGNEIKTYGYKPDSTWTTDPLFMKQGTDYYFYHNDHLGTPQKLTNTSGAVVWSATYDAFGKAAIDPSSTITNNLRFPGQYFDAETGLHYNFHRFYDPGLGRYLRGDPISFAGGGTNVYIYVQNDPVNLIDPWGLSEEGAMAVYGETSGIYPQLLPKTRNIYRRQNWDPASFEKLQEARKYIADVRERNKNTMVSKPCSENAIEKMIWKDALDAAAGAENWNLPKNVRHFFLRQEGVGPQKPGWATGMTPYATFGPFINVGGGDVPRGSTAFIDFYQGVP